jgi:eukaryotic-like serine/threonine-protein kinase
MAASRLADRYQPLTLLGSGGMASVHVARLIAAGGVERLVVLKRVHPHLLAQREFCDMFLDEGRIASLIRHANVLSVVDAVENDGEVALVLDYVEGVSLADLLTAAAQRDEALAPAVVSRIGVDLLGGLHAAHETVDLQGRPLDVVHRDVSPGNVIVGIDGTSRLIDFGIAKASTRLTQTDSGVVKGKFSYMAPEQIKHQDVDRRADVFAASVVLYQALTGRSPFRGENDADTVLRVMVGDVPDPSTLRPDVDPAFDVVLQRGLERDRELRVATAAELREALERACPPAPAAEVAALVERLAGDSLAARRRALQESLMAPAGPPPRVAPDPPTRAPATVRTARRRRGGLWGVAAGSALVVAVAAAAQHLGRASAPEPVEVAPLEAGTPSATPAASPALSVATPTPEAVSASAPPVRSRPRMPAAAGKPRPSSGDPLLRSSPYGR